MKVAGDLPTMTGAMPTRAARDVRVRKGDLIAARVGMVRGRRSMPTQTAAIDPSTSIAVSRGRSCRHGTHPQVRGRLCRHGTIAFVVVLGLLGGRVFAADALSPERQNELLQSGIAVFDQAVAISRESPQRASELYRQAASNFEALIDAGVHNESIEFNLGNTHFRLKDLGRAILHYRRAQLHAPGDARVAANLAYARDKVEPRISATGETQLVDRLLFWNRNVSRNVRFWLAALASIAGWGLLLAQLRWKRPALLWLGAASVIFGLASAMTVYVELNRESRTPAAVVVTPNTVLRQGRGENYEPILKQSLGSGVEVTVLNRRADWCEVQLLSGQTGWLPVTAIALIR